MKTTLPAAHQARAPSGVLYATIACLAASAPAINTAVAADAAAPAQQCLTDLHAFDSVQQKDGYGAKRPAGRLCAIIFN